MIRKQIYLETEQDALLKRLARESGQSEAEIIRQALEHHAHSVRHSRRDLRRWDDERAFIEHLIAQAVTPSPRQWTRDELYDR